MDNYQSIFRRTKTSFRTHLLRPTLFHAATHSAFYKSHLGEAWRRVTEIDDLEALPTTSKELLSAVSKNDILTSSEEPHIVQHTSGTTGKPFHVYRSQREVDFIRAFLAKDLESIQSEGTNILSFNPPDHGTPIELGLNAHVSNFDLRREHDREIVRNGITNSTLLANVRYVTGTFHQIRYLTKMLIDLGYASLPSAVRAIFVTGHQVTSRWRTLISGTWHVPLFNRFSQTEGFSGALECGTCGYFHFDHFVIPEVLDLDSRQPRTSGFGLLHLTSLYPFVQLMPFIRYNTNDLVEAMETPCNQNHEMSIRLLGRWEYAGKVNRHGRNIVLITPAPLFDFLDGLADVNADRTDSTPSKASTLALVGNPRYQLAVHDDGPVKIRLRLELRYNPQLYPKRSDEVGAIVIERMRDLNPALREFEQSNEIHWDIQMCAPGSVSSFDPSVVP